jgi:hypothetical protein
MIRILLVAGILVAIFLLAVMFGKISRQVQDKFTTFAAIFLPIVSIFFIVTTFEKIISSDASSADWMVFIFALLALGAGISLLMEQFKESEKPATNDAKSKIIQLAKDYRGKITPINVATSLEISVKTAEQKLDTLCQEKICEIASSDNGQIYYCFPEFLPKTERLEAPS